MFFCAALTAAAQQAPAPVTESMVVEATIDQLQAMTGPRSALHGIPVILKDAITTADQLRTSNGSYWLMDATPTHDATVARKLKDAGALILAKGNMDEMSRVTDAWSTKHSLRSCTGFDICKGWFHLSHRRRY